MKTMLRFFVSDHKGAVLTAVMGSLLLQGQGAMGMTDATAFASPARAVPAQASPPRTPEEKSLSANNYAGLRHALEHGRFGSVLQGLRYCPEFFETFNWQEYTSTAELIAYAVRQKDTSVGCIVSHYAPKLYPVIKQFTESRQFTRAQELLNLATALETETLDGQEIQTHLSSLRLWGSKIPMWDKDCVSALLQHLAVNNCTAGLDWLESNCSVASSLIEPATRAAMRANKIEAAKALIAQSSQENLQEYAYKAIALDNETLLEYVLQKAPQINVPEMLTRAIENSRFNITRYLVSLEQIAAHIPLATRRAIRCATAVRDALDRAKQAQCDDCTTALCARKVETANAIVKLLVAKYTPKKLLEDITALMDEGTLATNPQTPTTPRRTTVVATNLEIVRHLVEIIGVDRDLADQTAIRAIENDHTDIADYLFEKQAVRPDQLMLRAQQERLTKTHQYLLEKCPTMCPEATLQAAELGNESYYRAAAATEHANTAAMELALILAIKNTYPQTITTAFRQSGTNVCINALHRAIGAGITDVAARIIEELEQRTDKNNADLTSTLDHAVRTRQSTVVRALLSAFEFTRDNRIHVLFLAAENNDPTTMQAIEQSPLKLTADDLNALMYHATETGALDAIHYLLNKPEYTNALDDLVMLAQRLAHPGSNHAAIVHLMVNEHRDRINLPVITAWAHGVGAVELERLANAGPHPAPQCAEAVGPQPELVAAAQNLLGTNPAVPA